MEESTLIFHINKGDSLEHKFVSGFFGNVGEVYQPLYYFVRGGTFFMRVRTDREEKNCTVAYHSRDRLKL